MKGMNFMVVITMTFVISIIATLILAGVAGGQGSEITNFGDNNTDRADTITDESTDNLLIDEEGSSESGSTGNGDSNGSGGNDIKPSDNVSIDLVGNTYFENTKKDEDGDTPVILSDGQGDMSEKTKYKLKNGYIVGRFESGYNMTHRMKEDRGGVKRKIWVKNLQTSQSLVSDKDDNYGYAWLPKRTWEGGIGNTNVSDIDGEVIEGEGNSQVVGNSFNFSVVDSDCTWNWGKSSVKCEGSEAKSFTDLYPGKNAFKVEVLESNTGATISGPVTFTINKEAKYKLYYKNTNSDYTGKVFNQPEDRLVWHYVYGDTTKSKKKYLYAFSEDGSASEPESGYNIDKGKFVAEFPEPDKNDVEYELEVNKKSGETPSANARETFPVSSTGDSGSLSVDGIGQEGFYIEEDQREGDSMKFNVKLIKEVEDNQNTVAEKSFEFVYWEDEKEKVN